MTVAALVAARNAQRHIGECLDSLGEFDSVLIRDDASTDRTVAIAEAFGYPVALNLEQQGQSLTKTRLALACDSTYCTFTDSDDRRFPGTLARQVGTLDAGADVAIAPVLDTQGREYSIVANPWAVAWWGVPEVAVVWRTALLKTLLEQPLAEGAPGHQLLVRAIALNARFAFTPKPVAMYRNDWSEDQAHRRSGPAVLACRDELRAIAPSHIQDMFSRLELVRRA